MSEYSSISSRRSRNRSITRIFYFFPLQLLLLHIKRNHILLFFWLLLLLYVTGGLGAGYGLDTLFLAPVYLGKTGFWSFLIIGFSLGGFIMAFHIYSYILFSRDFKFLATLSRPFLKFCLNNMLIPLAFILVYFSKFINFLQRKSCFLHWLLFIICSLFPLVLFYSI